MKKNILKFLILIIITYTGFEACTEWARDNPLDPKGKNKPDVNLSVISYNDRIELSWNRSNMTGIAGYNIYRKSDSDSGYSLIAESNSPAIEQYTDDSISLMTTYFYYITLLGQSGESAPSNTVSITPGLGYNWVVDKWGYQVLRLTYDGQHRMTRYLTDWSPQDIAIDANRQKAIITQPAGHRIDIIETSGASLLGIITSNDYSFIFKPYLTEFEPTNDMFWVSDSGGSVYRISSTDFRPHLSNSNISKPGELFINQYENMVYVVDDNSDQIYRFDFNGDYADDFNSIGGYNFNNPKKIIFDQNDNRFWLIDESDNYYLYTGFMDNSSISLIDSFEYVYEIDINPFDHTTWLSIYEESTYKILQLSKAGDRQLELTGFYKPYHVTHNPYDGTLLVTDSGNGRILHYIHDFIEPGIYKKLNTPIRLEVE